MAKKLGKKDKKKTKKEEKEKKLKKAKKLKEKKQKDKKSKKAKTKSKEKKTKKKKKIKQQNQPEKAKESELEVLVKDSPKKDITKKFTDRSANYNTKQALLHMRLLNNVADVKAFVRGEKRVTITRSVNAVIKKLGANK